ncbi:uncharacterized protein [Parasteatoda tepidariorum]|uniref:uncharacterized protein isoform X4 n=1 Tax=Parasteatoda tepidariorum TaxID=114398 RepID=UPI001C724E56|nr:protein shisa-like-2A isoform X1 [Parasteatoda tepidariorum]XP_042902686.1 protein shisa-like-2A isoform X2 [Parasteatoda tepidariorum]
MGDIDVKELSSHDHEVLGVDFCSGYTDIFGKWNTGFNCPRVGNSKVVYCCGTVTYKYCCTRRDHHSGSGISQSVLLGSALGSMVVIIFVTLVSCLICRRCVPYRRHHASLNGGPLYALHCSSTTSGMANVYSFPCQSSIVTTPLDSSHVLLGVEQPEHIYAVPMNSQRGISRHLMAGSIAVQCSTPTDPPPSYTEASASAAATSVVERASPKPERNISNETEKEDTSLSLPQNLRPNVQASEHESTDSVSRM